MAANAVSAVSWDFFGGTGFEQIFQQNGMGLEDTTLMVQKSGNSPVEVGSKNIIIYEAL